MVHSGVLYIFGETAGPPKRRGARVANPLPHPLDGPASTYHLATTPHD